MSDEKTLDKKTCGETCGETLCGKIRCVTCDATGCYICCKFSKCEVSECQNIICEGCTFLEKDIYSICENCSYTSCTNKEYRQMLERMQKLEFLQICWCMGNNFPKELSTIIADYATSK